MRTISAILFDFDDTLRDWRTAIDAAVERVIAGAAVEDPESTRASLWRAIEEHCVVWRDGMVMDRAYWKLLYDSGEVLAAVLPKGTHELEDLASAFRRELRPPLFADTLPALDALSHEVRMGILSNNPRATEAAERQGIAVYFDSVVGLAPDTGKPAHAAFVRGCDALQVRPGECAYVGDSYAHDLIGAAEAGLLSVWLDRDGFDYPLPEGTLRVTTLTAVHGVLEPYLNHGVKR